MTLKEMGKESFHLEFHENYFVNGITLSFIIVRNLLTNPEVSKLRICMEQSKDILNYAHGRADDTGKSN